MGEIVGLTPVWQQSQFFDNAGQPLANGRLWTYASGVDETYPTWTDKTGTIPNANPIRLDSSGRIQTEIWLRAGDYYGFVLEDQAGNFLTRVRDVTVQQLLAGTNITLDPPSGVGPAVTINAAGSVGEPKGRGQSYLFSSSGGSLHFDNVPYSTMTFTALTTSITPTPDVTIAGGNIYFSDAGTYEVEITTTFSCPANWPSGQSAFGVTVTNAIQSKSYHNRYSNGTGDGLGSTYQQVSFTDTFIVTGHNNTPLSVYATNTATTQVLNLSMQIVATRVEAPAP